MELSDKKNDDIPISGCLILSAGGCFSTLIAIAMIGLAIKFLLWVIRL